MNKQSIFLLLLVIAVFIFTRGYKLNTIPASLYWDEASIGYNAYSILKTGRDEGGQFLPVHFRSFGEYKLPVYIYSVSLVQFFTGPTILSVRLPAVFYSLGILIVIFFLTRLLFGTKTAFLAAFFYTVTPWGFLFSRVGYEASAGLMFFLLGVYLACKDDTRSYFLSAVFFVLSMYSYNSFRILAPLVFVLLTIFPISKDKVKKMLAIKFLIFVIGMVPMIFLYFNAGTGRLDDIGIFNQSLGNIGQTKLFVKNFLSHFSIDFLLGGDKNLRNQLPGWGQIYLAQLILATFGLIRLVFRINKKQALVLMLFLISFIPSSITREAPHALRAITAVPMIAIITAVGVEIVIAITNRIVRASKVLSFLLGFLIIYFMYLFGQYFWSFLNEYNFKSGEYWQYGYKQIYDKYAKSFDKYNFINISDGYAQPYIFAAFYLRFDPSRFQNERTENTTIRKATSLIRNYDKYVFANIDFYNLPKGRNLMFAHPSEKLTEIGYADTVKNPDGSVAFYVYEYESQE